MNARGRVCLSASNLYGLGKPLYPSRANLYGALFRYIQEFYSGAQVTLASMFHIDPEAILGEAPSDRNKRLV